MSASPPPAISSEAGSLSSSASANQIQHAGDQQPVIQRTASNCSGKTSATFEDSAPVAECSIGSANQFQHAGAPSSVSIDISQEGGANTVAPGSKGCPLVPPASESELVAEKSLPAEHMQSESSRSLKAQPSKPLWSSLVQNKFCLSQHVFTASAVDDGPPVVEIPDDVLQEAPPLWEDFLIGNFLDKAPHIAKVHVIVNKIWTYGNQSIKVDAFVVNENTIKFRIRDTSIRARVIRRGMWNIADVPMIVSKWAPKSEESQAAIRSIPMWITIKHVPHKMFSWKGLGFLASDVGVPKRLHPDTELCKDFDEAKVFVEANLTKELPSSFRFKSEQGVDAVVDFKYPWLPPRCSVCAKWGHLSASCLAKGCPSGLTTPVETSLPAKTIIPDARDTTPSLTDIVYNNAATSPVVISKTSTQSIVPNAEPYSHEDVTEDPILDKTGAEAESIDAEQIVKTMDTKVMENEEGWSTVSPTKLGKLGRQLDLPTNGDNTISVSPSRFSALQDITAYESGEGLNDMQDIEEGEISEPIDLPTTKTSRLVLPRASKVTQKHHMNTSAQTTKEKQQFSSNKRVSRRRN